MQIVTEFLKDMRLEGKARSTLVEYKNRLSIYQKYLNRHEISISEVKHEDILEFKREMLNFGWNPTTLKSVLSTIYVFNIWGRRNGVIKTMPLSPADYPKITSRKRIKRLTDEDLRLFTVYIDSLQENVRAAFWLMIGTGARVGEVAHLNMTDVQMRGRSIYVNITDAKWGSDRFIPIVDKQAAEIVWRFRQTVSADNRPLFRLSKRTLQWYATKFAQDTGIDFHCHLLRHTFAAKLTEKGVLITTVQFLLGHRSVSMTAYYAKSALVDVESITPKI